MSESRSDIRIQRAMSIFQEGLGSEPNPIEFFLAWAIPPPVIAERLRRSGFEADANEINTIIENGYRSKMDNYLLSVAMMEMKNDIIKTLYK